MMNRSNIGAKLRLMLLSVAIFAFFIALAIKSGNRKHQSIYSPLTSEGDLTKPEEKLTKSRIREKLYIEYIDTVSNFNRIFKVKRKKRFPDVIGIGVEKCGTGALRQIISNHPIVRFADPPELHFFDSADYSQGLEYYKSEMPEVTDYEIVMEKTPAYFNWPPKDLPKMIHRGIPEAKIVVVLCDPVNRTISDFVQEKLMGTVPEYSNFEVFILHLMSLVSTRLGQLQQNDTYAIDYIMKLLEDRKESHILTAGLYYLHMRRWLAAYSQREIHIIDGDKLILDPGTVIEEFQDFLGIPKLIIKEDFVKGPSGFFCIAPPIVEESKGRRIVVNRPAKCMPQRSKGRTRMGNWAPDVSKFGLETLRQFYAPYNKKLYRLLGTKFDWQ